MLSRTASALAFWWLLNAEVSAHNWYPPDCCHNRDCAPVLDIERLDTGDFRVRSIHGTATVTPQTRLLESQDAQPHVCIREGRAVCYFIPPSN